MDALCNLLIYGFGKIFSSGLHSPGYFGLHPVAHCEQAEPAT